MHRLEPCVDVAVDLRDRAAPDPVVRGAHVEDSSGIERFDPEHLRDAPGHQPEPPLALFQGLLGAASRHAEFDHQHSEGAEHDQADDVLRRNGKEGIRGWNEPVEDAGRGGEQGHQSRPTAAVPRAYHHRADREAVHGDPGRERKQHPDEHRQARQRQGNSVASERMASGPEQIDHEAASPRIYRFPCRQSRRARFSRVRVSAASTTRTAPPQRGS